MVRSVGTSDWDGSGDDSDIEDSDIEDSDVEDDEDDWSDEDDDDDWSDEDDEDDEDEDEDGDEYEDEYEDGDDDGEDYEGSQQYTDEYDGYDGEENDVEHGDMDYVDYDKYYNDGYEDEPHDDDEKSVELVDETHEKKIFAILFGVILCLLVGGVIGTVVVFLKRGDSGGGDDSSDEVTNPGNRQPTDDDDMNDRQYPTFPPVTFPPFPPYSSSKVPPTLFPTKSPAPTITVTSKPTSFPSIYPTMSPTSTLSPTQTVPDDLFIVPDADTHVYSRGADVGEAQGEEETFLIQNGPEDLFSQPDSVGLLIFSLESVPEPSKIVDRDNTAMLYLQHIPNMFERGTLTYSLVRLPGTPLPIETFHGYMFQPKPGIKGPSFTVGQNDTRIEIDITNLVFGQPPYSGSNADTAENTDTDEQLYLMILPQLQETAAGGDRFYTRESDHPPLLHIALKGPGYVPPGLTAPPSTSVQPSPSPTASNAPSKSPAPSDSRGPTSQPSLSQFPTSKVVGSALPSAISSTEPSNQ